MAKANAEATSDRVDHTQRMILAVEMNIACVAYARQIFEISRSQGYRLIKLAGRQIRHDIEDLDLDRQEMLAWRVQTLLETAGQAKAQQNLGVVVSTIRQLDWMGGLGITHTRGSESTIRGCGLAIELLSFGNSRLCWAD